LARSLNDHGTVHMIEAALASVLVVAVLFFVNSTVVGPSGGRPNDLGSLSSDLLNVITYRGSSLEHPSLGFTLSSEDRWKNGSAALYTDIKSMLPDGVYCFMVTPYGTLGPAPGDGMEAYSRPFLAYGNVGHGRGQMLDCKLVLWRA
jgi:hypothetical protein